MKKWLLKLSLVAMTLLLLPIQAVQACCGFIIGRQLTKDGTTLFGRTEDYPYYPNGGKHNKNFVVVDAKNYKEGDQLEDESNGFTYPHAASEMNTQRLMTLLVEMVVTVPLVNMDLTKPASL